MNQQAKKIEPQIDIHDLSNWFLSQKGSEITNKKLQKLCYYAVAWGWALMNKNIANNSQFQAWQHGPVSQTLFNKYHPYGWNVLPATKKPENIPGDVEELLESVWLTYGDKSGNELEALSHSELPWRAARGGLSDDAPSTAIISASVMRNFYNGIKSTEY